MRDRPQMIICSIRIACCIPKATNTPSEYITLIALPLQHGCKNTPPCYITRTLPVLYLSSLQEIQSAQCAVICKHLSIYSSSTTISDTFTVDNVFDTDSSKHCKLLTSHCGYCVGCHPTEISSLLPRSSTTCNIQ
jgi:hypothetical protein